MKIVFEWYKRNNKLCETNIKSFVFVGYFDNNIFIFLF